MANWKRVTRDDLERLARFPSVAAQNALKVMADYSDPVVLSLHISAFVVMERSDVALIFNQRGKFREAPDA